MVQRSKAGLVSRAGMAIGCASTPFYYYFKAKDKSVGPYDDAEIQTLGKLGEEQKDEFSHGADRPF